MTNQHTPAGLISELAQRGGFSFENKPSVESLRYLTLMMVELSDSLADARGKPMLGITQREYPDLDNPIGLEFTIENHFTGQQWSLVIDHDGVPIKRSYSDRGDIHADMLVKGLRGWLKGIDQARNGGRPKGSGTPKQDYTAILKQLAKSGLSEREFERETGISRSTIRRAKDKRRKDSRNR